MTVAGCRWGCGRPTDAAAEPRGGRASSAPCPRASPVRDPGPVAGADGRVLHQDQQVILALDVAVERHGRDADLGGDAAHGERGEPLRVGDPDGSRDDPRHVQPSRRTPARPLPQAPGGLDARRKAGPGPLSLRHSAAFPVASLLPFPLGSCIAYAVTFTSYTVSRMSYTEGGGDSHVLSSTRKLGGRGAGADQVLRRGARAVRAGSASAARQRLRTARAQRRGQDHHRPRPDDAHPRRQRPGVGGGPRRGRRARQGAPRHQPHRAVRRLGRGADGRGEPPDDGPAAWPLPGRGGTAGGRAAGALRAHGRGPAPRLDLLGRHAAPSGHRGGAGDRPGGRLPGRAHHGARPAQPPHDVGGRERAHAARGSPSSSRPSTWRRPTGSPTTSPSWARAGSSPRAARTS